MELVILFFQGRALYLPVVTHRSSWQELAHQDEGVKGRR